MWACGLLSCPKNCLFWTRVSNPCLISKFVLQFQNNNWSSYPRWGPGAILPIVHDISIRNMEVQQDSEELVVDVVVVDVDDELENECACTKIENKKSIFGFLVYSQSILNGQEPKLDNLNPNNQNTSR
ncbi:hypothetical protein Tco_0649520 [Tanacetum coccineum]